MSVGQGSSHMFDPELGATVLNETSVSTDDVMNELAKLGPEWRMVANWQQKTQSRSGGIFQRDRYLTPDSIFDQFRTAKIASETDDVVSGVVEATEALAFNRMTVDVEDADEEDIWNQIVDDLDLDNHMRSIWRELFIVSQCYVGTLWGRRSYKVRGKTRKGIRRKKDFKNLAVPIGLTILDPLKVIPVGNFMFGAEKLAYIADKSESEDFDHVLAGENTADLPVQQLISEKYIPSESEKKYLKELTGERSLENLYVLNPDKVYRHTATRPSYARFAPCRMKSIFELLDLKQQLRQMDRAHLIGGSNFIVLITMGDKDHYPAQGDLAAMRNQVQVNARVPVIVGDYTLDVKIVTPKLDMTLKAERHNAIDSRITARLYQLASSGNYSSGYSGDDSIKLSKVIARGLESRRYIMKREIESNILDKAFERNEQFTSKPSIAFHPRTISLNFDPNFANFMFDIYQHGDISRETFLSEFDLSQSEEARKRESEKEQFGKTFTPDEQMTQKGAGRRFGGNNNGGGNVREGYNSQPGRGPAEDSPQRAEPSDQGGGK